MLKFNPMARLPNTLSPTFSPLYQQIRELITKSLESGEWGPGDIIPSESELAERFGVSQGTVRKAIDEMAAGNLLVRRQGKGTFVATHDDPRSFFRFLRLAANDGQQLTLKSHPLECWRAKAGADVARILALDPGAAARHDTSACRWADRKHQTAKTAVCTGSQCQIWPYIGSSKAQIIPKPMPALSTTQPCRA